jgi:hypothetical protein
MIPVDGFGSFPVAIEIDPDAHDGPSWELFWFRHRTGWLRIVELELRSNARTYAETRVLVCDSHDEICPPWLAGNLFRAAITGVRPIEDEPPALLDALERAALEDFRKACARDNSRALQRLEEQTALHIGNLERAAEQELEALRDRLAAWRRAARMGWLADDEIDRLPNVLVGLDASMDAIVQRTSMAVGRLRAELARRADGIISAFQPKAFIHHIGTAHWRLRHQRAYVRGNWWDAGEDVHDWLPSHVRQNMRKAI